MRALVKQYIVLICLLFAMAPYTATAADIETTAKSAEQADPVSRAIEAISLNRFYYALTILDAYRTATPDHSPNIYYHSARAAYGSGFYKRAAGFLALYYEKTDDTIYAREAASLKQLVETALAAIGASDESAFTFVKAQHTIFAYASYARNYPEGVHIEEADDLSYQRANQLNSEIGFNRYLEFWPTGRYAAEMERKADNAAIRIALKLNTVKAYNAYLNDYPAGAHRKQATERMTAQAFFQARADGSVIALKHFLATYPKSLYQREAETAIKKAELETPRLMLSGPLVVIPVGFVAMKQTSKMTADTPPPVRIKAPLKAMAHEVTFAQYDACLKAGACSSHTPHDEGWGRGKRPVINVSHSDIALFTAWFNAQWQALGGRGLWRLPSEAEWTYMARGRVGQLEITQSSVRGGNAVCDDCDNLPGGNITLPVGSGKANSYGLYDMLSNVAEWVADCWHSDVQSRPKDGTPYMPTDDSCTDGTVRGAASAGMPALLAREARASYPFTHRSPSIGFRLVLEGS